MIQRFKAMTAQAAMQVAVAVLALVVTAAGVRAESFVFDKGHTLIAFSWTRLGMSRQQGRINSYEGGIEIDPEKPEEAKVDVTLRANSLQTGFDPLDRALRGADYFDAAGHPVITFKSTEIKRTGEKTADVTGDLMIRGITKPVTLSVTLTFLGDHPLSAAAPVYAGKRAIAFSARASVSRSAFGLTRATPMVSDEIDIVIETELISRN